MPELTLHSKRVYTDEVLELPKDAKIFHVEYINKNMLIVFYTTSRITYAERLKAEGKLRL